MLALVSWSAMIVRTRREVGVQMTRWRRILSWIAWGLVGCCASAYLVRDFERVPLELRTGLLLLLGTVVVLRWVGPVGWLRVLASSAVLLGVLGAATRLRPLTLGLSDRHLFLIEGLALLGAFFAAVWCSEPENRALVQAARHELRDELRRGVSFAWLVVALSAAAWPALYWQASTAQHAWQRSALLLTAGMASSLSWLHARPRITVAATLGLLASGALLSWFQPANEVNLAPTVCKRILLAAPAALAAFWLALDARRFRGQRSCNATAALFALLAVLVFARANFIQPQLSVIQSVLALHEEHGSIVWQTDIFDTPSGRVSTHRTSHASPTPCSNGRVIVAHFGNGTAGLTRNGTILWKHEHLEFSDAAVYGAGSSPVIAGDSVVVVQGRERRSPSAPSFAVAYRLESGEERWRCERPNARNSYGTPILLPTAEGTQLVMPAWRSIVSHAADSGRILWSQAVEIEEVVTSAVEDTGMLFVAGGSMKARTIGLRLAHEDRSRAAPEVLWETTRSTPSCSSPVLYQGRLFTVSDGGIMTCFEACSGVVLWRERIASGEYYASLAAGDGKVFATNAEGTTTVVAASAEFRILAENHLDEPVLASPALTDGSIFLRGEVNLYRLNRPGRDEVGVASTAQARGAARYP